MNIKKRNPKLTALQLIAVVSTVVDPVTYPVVWLAHAIGAGKLVLLTV